MNIKSAAPLRLHSSSVFALSIAVFILTALTASPPHAVLVAAQHEHMPVIPRMGGKDHPMNVHSMSIMDDTRDGKTLVMDGVQFADDTALLIEIDVAHAVIELRNSVFSTVAVHLHEPEFLDFHRDLGQGVRFFQDAEVKHSQAYAENRKKRSVGARVQFRLVNCTVPWGLKFVGATYFHDAEVRLIGYDGGPVVMPRVRTHSTKHSPLLSVVNSTIRYHSQPQINGKPHWFHRNDVALRHELLRFPHNAVDDSIRHGVNAERFQAPTIHLYGNRFEGGVVWLNEEDSLRDVVDDVIVRNNTFLSASLRNLQPWNSSVGNIEVVGNRWIGEIDPTMSSWAVQVKVLSFPRIVVVENHFELRFRETGMGVGDNVNVPSQAVIEIDAGVSAHVEVSNNRVIVRHCEYFFDRGIEIKGGYHVSVRNNHVFISSRPAHMFAHGDHHERIRPLASLYGLSVVDSTTMIKRQLMKTARRFVVIDGNVLNVRRYRPVRPPLHLWKNLDPWEKLDDKRSQEEINRARKKRRRYLFKYHNKKMDYDRQRTHDSWNDFVRLAYQDPDYDGEHAGGDAIGLQLKTVIATKVLISNNTASANNTMHHGPAVACEVEVTPWHGVWGHSFLDVVGNRFMATGLAAAVGFNVRVMLNATDNIIRENEIWCRFGHGHCVELGAFHSKEHSDHNEKHPHPRKHGLPLYEGRTDFIGTTFRRNKVRAMPWRQHIALGQATALSVGGGLETEDLSHYIQDNDVRGRGLCVFVASTSPRLIFENNFWKTIGHLAEGFFSLLNTRELFMHHEQLERAPLSPPDWFEKHSEPHFELEKLHNKMNFHPHEKLTDWLTTHANEHEKERHRQREEQHLTLRSAFITASRAHSVSLSAIREDEPVDDEHLLHALHRPIPKMKYSASESKVMPAEGLGGGGGDADSAVGTSNAEKERTGAGAGGGEVSLSKSKPDGGAGAGSAERSVAQVLEKERSQLTHPRAQVILLSPVFAHNMTFPRASYGHSNRWFSIQCIAVNGRPLEFEEIKNMLPHVNMSKHELALPTHSLVPNSTDEVEFGCPDDAHVERAVGSAHEDL